MKKTIISLFVLTVLFVGVFLLNGCKEKNKIKTATAERTIVIENNLTKIQECFLPYKTKVIQVSDNEINIELPSDAYFVCVDSVTTKLTLEKSIKYICQSADDEMGCGAEFNEGMFLCLHKNNKGACESFTDKKFKTIIDFNQGVSILLDQNETKKLNKFDVKMFDIPEIEERFNAFIDENKENLKEDKGEDMLYLNILGCAWTLADL